MFVVRVLLVLAVVKRPDPEEPAEPDPGEYDNKKDKKLVRH